MRGLVETETVERPVCLSDLAHGLGINGPQICLSQVFQRLGSTLPSLDVWLSQNPNIANAIVWQDAAGTHPWPTWDGEMQDELTDAFEHAWLRSPIPVAPVPPNLVQLTDDQDAVTVIPADDAWSYFKASVAQSLAIEIGGGWAPGGARVPWWTITVFTAEQLAQLLDSREMFFWNADPAGYQILWYYHATVVPGPPWYSYDFLFGNNLIADTRPELIGRLLDWCRSNLNHAGGGFDTGSQQDFWQYRGWPPVVRIIDGTTQMSEAQEGIAHWTRGCWGTTGFLRAVLRSVNIPVKLVIPADHAHPWFMADGLYLSHGDDPYGYFRLMPEVPGQALPIDQATWDAWFGPALTFAQRHNNVDRQTSVLVQDYLPNFILSYHCQDLAGGIYDGVNAGKVMNVLYKWYTPAQLLAMGFFAEMDAKIAALGGCAKVPPAPF